MTAIQRERTLRELGKLVESPQRCDVVRLRSQNDVWRLKYGDLRALFEYEDTDTIMVLWIGTRQSAKRQY